MGDHERRKAEIGLGLAAAGWEEQQVGGLAVDMRAIDEAGEIEQDEGELERPPLRFRQCLRIASGARIAAPRGHGDGEIHEAEGRPRSGVPGQDVDAGRRCGSLPFPCRR